jgi:pimeloyl-ACP methyl ester carboxylesterase/type 1 glutamine amidotransferase
MKPIILASLSFMLIPVHPTIAADRQPIKVLIITGDHGHDWKATTPFLKALLTKAGLSVDVTETPAKDLTAANLAKYDVLFLNYKDTKNGKPDTRWSDANRKAFADAVEEGKGLVVYHHASSAFIGGSAFDSQFEKLIAGGWRRQGNHGKRHVFEVTIRKADHPITRGLPDHFRHANDELYQNSLIPADAEILATAYSDKKMDPKNSGKDEPVVWVTKRGKGRVCENVLGHDVAAMQDAGFQNLLVHCVEWAATGEVQSRGSASAKRISFPTQDGGLIYADLYGRGERGVVLAHGARFNKESWKQQAPILAKAGFRVLAIDFRGYGQSRGPGQSQPFSAPLHLDVLAAVRYLHQTGAKSVSVLGASMGGGAAANAASEAKPGEIERLVLLGSAGGEQPEKMQGRKLFITSRDDPGPDGKPRLEAIREQYEKTPGPKELVILEGSAHAQHLFATDQGERLMQEILRFLAASQTATPEDRSSR